MTKRLEDVIVPIKQQSKKLRLGPYSDGGYVCLSDFLRKDMMIFSFGVGFGIPFEVDAIEKYNANVICWDALSEPSSPTLKKYPKKIKHINEFITKENTNSIFNSYENKQLLVQMDIEGAEFEFIESISKENIQKIETLLIEFHWDFGHSKTEKQMVKCLEKILETHICFHVHGNNDQPYRKGTKMPSILECSFIRKDLSLTTEIDDANYPIEGIDAANGPGTDLKLDWWKV